MARTQNLLRSAAAALAAAAVMGAADGPGIVSLYYKGSMPDIKYNAGNGWTTCPGSGCIAFSPSTNASFPASAGWSYVQFAANAATWVELTPDGGSYDHCTGGANCAVAAPGIYTQAYGAVSALATFAPGCPATCVAPRGSCTQPGTICTCSAGYLGADCSATCPAGSNGLPCSGHGQCSSSQPTCSCETGWASCGSGAEAACGTSVSSDPNNCGGCGVVCAANPGAGIASATCGNATCNVVCAPGFVSCSPGTCTPGSDPSACPLPGCQTYNDNQCSGDNITTPASYIARMWQAPAPGEPGYLPSYQQHAFLQGYARIVYTDTTRTAGNVSAVTFQRNAAAVLSFSFDGGKTASTQPWAVVCSSTYAGSAACDVRSDESSINVTVTSSDGTALAMEPLYLYWAQPALGPTPAGRDDRGGQKGAIIELFGWPHKDIAAECADIASWGYLGVKIWNPAETVLSWEPFNGAMNPWYFEYQPVSYRLESRLGSSADLRAMITTCRAAGVRVYWDAVNNHMVGAGNDALLQHRNAAGSSCTYWPAKTSTATLWNTTYAGGSFTATQDYQFEANAHSGLPPSQEFTSVPFNPTHFHCERTLSSWTDPIDLNAGWLEGECRRACWICWNHAQSHS